MAWVQTIEQTHLRTGSADWQSYGDSARVFLVQTNSRTDLDDVALFATGVPAIFDAHPTRPLLYVSNKQCRVVDDKNGKLWEVTVTYGLIVNILPWNQPVVYNWSQQSSEHACDFTVDTPPLDIKNSAGRPFDPPVMATRYEAVLQCVRNELSFSASTPLAYVGAVNSDTFKGASPGFCMCVGIQASQQTYTNGAGTQYIYWQVTYNFAFRNQYSWQPIVLDAGLSQLAPATGTGGGYVLVNILDKQGREVTTPWPLNGSGVVLPIPDIGTPADYVRYQFNVYPQVAFGSLGL